MRGLLLEAPLSISPPETETGTEMRRREEKWTKTRIERKIRGQ
jgi:hypothetical protein